MSVLRSMLNISYLFLTRCNFTAFATGAGDMVSSSSALNACAMSEQPHAAVPAMQHLSETVALALAAEKMHRWDTTRHISRLRAGWFWRVQHVWWWRWLVSSGQWWLIIIYHHLSRLIKPWPSKKHHNGWVCPKTMDIYPETAGYLSRSNRFIEGQGSGEYCWWVVASDQWWLMVDDSSSCRLIRLRAGDDKSQPRMVASQTLPTTGFAFKLGKMQNRSGNCCTLRFCMEER